MSSDTVLASARVAAQRQSQLKPWAGSTAGQAGETIRRWSLTSFQVRGISAWDNVLHESCNKPCVGLMSSQNAHRNL